MVIRKYMQTFLKLNSGDFHGHRPNSFMLSFPVRIQSFPTVCITLYTHLWKQISEMSSHSSYWVNNSKMQFSHENLRIYVYAHFSYEMNTKIMSKNTIEMPLNSGIIISRQASRNASFVYHFYTFTAIQPLNSAWIRK